MNIVVSYSDYDKSVIDKVEIPFSEDVVKEISVDRTLETIEFRNIDNVSSFEIVETMTKEELSDYIKILQKIAMQI